MKIYPYLFYVFIFCGLNINAQNFAVTTKRNGFLYQWVKNELKIVLENKSCKITIAKAENGKITKIGCDFIYSVASDSVFNDEIKIGYLHKGKIKWMATEYCTILKIPDPNIVIDNFMDSFSINKVLFKITSGFEMPIHVGFCSYNDANIQKVTHYKARVFRGNKLIYQEEISQKEISNSLQNFVQENCLIGDKILFDNFEILLYRKEKRKVKFKIEATLLD